MYFKLPLAYMPTLPDAIGVPNQQFVTWYTSTGIQIFPLNYFSSFNLTQSNKERKGKELLFKCPLYLALRHTNWGHCKLKLTQIKCRFLRRGENRSTRGKTSQSREENQQTQPTYNAESRNGTRAILVGGECSNHFATTALSRMVPPLLIFLLTKTKWYFLNI